MLYMTLKLLDDWEFFLSRRLEDIGSAPESLLQDVFRVVREPCSPRGNALRDTRSSSSLEAAF